MQNNPLLKYDIARKALSEANSLDDIKTLSDKTEALQHYARQIHDEDMEMWLAEIKIRAKRKIGEITKEIPKSTPKTINPSAGVNKKKDVLAQAGISTQEASRCEKIADISKDKIEKTFKQAKESKKPVTFADIEKIASGDNNLATKFTGNNEWYTPGKYIESARKVMGSIDLDPASNDHAQEVVKAKTFYTINDDGLSKEWFGNIWMNPPYSAKEIKQFIEKLISSDFESAIILTNNSTDTSWFNSLAINCDSICFTNGRIKFYSKSGESSAPTNGQTFFYFGADRQQFKDVFNEHGLIMEVIK